MKTHYAAAIHSALTASPATTTPAEVERLREDYLKLALHVTGLDVDEAFVWSHAPEQIIDIGLQRDQRLREENERLENEAVLRKAAYDGVGSLLLEVQQDCIAEHNRATTAETALTEAKRREEKLVEALEPFAECCSEWDGEPASLHVFFQWTDEDNPVPSVTVEDFRRTRAALKEVQG
jgi:hypothetical protein